MSHVPNICGIPLKNRYEDARTDELRPLNRKFFEYVLADVLNVKSRACFFFLCSSPGNAAQVKVSSNMAGFRVNLLNRLVIAED